MKGIFTLLVLLITLSVQARNIDTLKQALSQSRTDSSRFKLLTQLTETYVFNNADSSLLYIRMAIGLAEKNRNPLWKAYTNATVSVYFLVTGDFASALDFAFRNINEFEKYKDA